MAKFNGVGVGGGGGRKWKSLVKLKTFIQYYNRICNVTFHCILQVYPVLNALYAIYTVDFM